MVPVTGGWGVVLATAVDPVRMMRSATYLSAVVKGEEGIYTRKLVTVIVCYPDSSACLHDRYMSYHHNAQERTKKRPKTRVLWQ